jgi:tetratricopeptide (TPR) repeat protein
MKSLPNSQMARLHKKLQAEENSRVFARLADQLRLRDHLEDAVDLLQKGLQFHPDYAIGYVVLGHCHLDMGAVKKARHAFLKALQLDSENLLVLKNLGDILFQQGELEEALKHYRRALELDPRNVDIQQVVDKLETRHQEEMTLAARRQAESESESESEPDSNPEQEIPLAAGVSPFGEQIFETMEPLSSYLEEEGSCDQVSEAEAQLSPEETELLRDQEEGEAGKGPPRGMATATLAEVYFQQGLLDKAIETYKRVLRHQPGDQAVKDRLSELRNLRLTKTRPKKGPRRKSTESPQPSQETQADLEPPADATEDE